MQKVYLLVVVLVVIGAAIMFFSDGMSPNAEDTSGTIVPAERYRADQIGSEDVVLGTGEAAGLVDPSVEVKSEAAYASNAANAANADDSHN